jgi:hypothetical protein
MQSTQFLLRGDIFCGVLVETLRTWTRGSGSDPRGPIGH